jgi:hypothetical protein
MTDHTDKPVHGPSEQPTATKSEARTVIASSVVGTTVEWRPWLPPCY